MFLDQLASAEEISRKASINCVVWLLVTVLKHVRNEEEQVMQGKVENIQFEEKGSTKKCNGAMSWAQGDKKYKEIPNAKWYKGRGDFQGHGCLTISYFGEDQSEARTGTAMSCCVWRWHNIVLTSDHGLSMEVASLSKP